MPDETGSTSSPSGRAYTTVAAVGGAIGALAALAIGIPALGAVVAALAGFVLVIVSMGAWGWRAVTHTSPSLEPRFPSPGN